MKFITMNFKVKYIFANFDVDYQMLGTCGQYEHLNNPWNAFFSCVIDRHFISILFEHPV